MSRRALVAIKRVVDYAVKVRVHPSGKCVDTSNVKMSMNPFCEIAIEEALRMREANHIDQVVAVSIGPKKTVDTIRVALSMGADRGLHVVLPNDHPDLHPLAVASVLKCVADAECPRVVLLGKQSIDGDNNQTGQMLAGLLDWPQATFASRIDFDKEPDAVHVTREVDGGLESLSVSLPAVITCDLRLNQPRFATLPNVMKARKKKIETIDVADLKVDVSSKMDLLNVSEPEKRPPGVFVDSVDELIHKLRSEAKVL